MHMSYIYMHIKEILYVCIWESFYTYIYAYESERREVGMLLSTVILKGDISPIPDSRFQSRYDYNYNVIVKTS